jgi:hypothetical protein
LEPREISMAKKSLVSEAVDAARSVAGAALGAAAVAATGVVVTRVAGAIRNSGTELEGSKPALQKLAANTIKKPLMPKKQKRAAATRKAKTAKKTAKKKVKTRKAAKKPRRRR